MVAPEPSMRKGRSRSGCPTMRRDEGDREMPRDDRLSAVSLMGACSRSESLGPPMTSLPSRFGRLVRRTIAWAGRVQVVRRPALSILDLLEDLAHPGPQERPLLGAGISIPPADALRLATIELVGFVAHRSPPPGWTDQMNEPMVEMGESRTPRPGPFAGDHYERVRSFSSTEGTRIGTLPFSPAACL